MRQSLHLLAITTHGKGLVAITAPILAWTSDQGIVTGLLTLWCRHTSASLTVQENADPRVLQDIAAYFDSLAPEDPTRYVHDDEGPDDMPAHIKSMLNGVSLHVPVTAGEWGLGTWQGIYVAEHRARPHRRDIVLQFLGRCRDS